MEKEPQPLQHLTSSYIHPFRSNPRSKLQPQALSRFQSNPTINLKMKVVMRLLMLISSSAFAYGLPIKSIDLNNLDGDLLFTKTKTTVVTEARLLRHDQHSSPQISAENIVGVVFGAIAIFLVNVMLLLLYIRRRRRQRRLKDDDSKTMKPRRSSLFSWSKKPNSNPSDQEESNLESKTKPSSSSQPGYLRSFFHSSDPRPKPSSLSKASKLSIRTDEPTIESETNHLQNKSGFFRISSRKSRQSLSNPNKEIPLSAHEALSPRKLLEEATEATIEDLKPKRDSRLLRLGSKFKKKTLDEEHQESQTDHHEIQTGSSSDLRTMKTSKFKNPLNRKSSIKIVTEVNEESHHPEPKQKSALEKVSQQVLSPIIKRRRASQDSKPDSEPHSKNLKSPNSEKKNKHFKSILGKFQQQNQKLIEEDDQTNETDDKEKKKK